MNKGINISSFDTRQRKHWVEIYLAGWTKDLDLLESLGIGPLVMFFCIWMMCTCQQLPFMCTIAFPRISAIKLEKVSKAQEEWVLIPQPSWQRTGQVSWTHYHTAIQGLEDKGLMEGIEIRSLYKDCTPVSKNHQVKKENFWFAQMTGESPNRQVTNK